MKENERMKDVSNLEKRRGRVSWNRLKRDISSSAHTIHEIDAGQGQVQPCPVRQQHPEQGKHLCRQG